MKKLIVLVIFSLTILSCNYNKKNVHSTKDIDLSWVNFLFTRSLNLPISEKNTGYFQQNVALGLDKGLIYREYKVNDEYLGDYTIFNFSDLTTDDNGFNHITLFSNDYIIVLGKKNIILLNLTDRKYSNVDPSTDVVNIPGIQKGKTELHDLGISEECIDIIPSSYLIDNNIEYNKSETYYYWTDNDSFVNYINQNNVLAIRKNGGLNESIVLKMLDLDYLRKISDSKIYILNGYVDFNKPYLFKQNNRLKKVSVFDNSSGKYISEVSFNDVVEFTEITVPSDCNELRIVITDVYEGTKYSDLCITGVLYGTYNYIHAIDQEKDTIRKLIKK